MNRLKVATNATIACAVTLLLGYLSCSGTRNAAEAQAQPANQAAVNLYNLGLTAYKDGSQEAAIIFFRRACDIDPNLADAHYNLAVIYQSQKRLKEAVPQFQEVLRLKPSDPDAHYQLGLCMIDLGQTADARTVLAGIPPNDKHFPDAQKRIGLIDAQAPQTGASSQPAALVGDAPSPVAPPVVASPPSIVSPPANQDQSPSFSTVVQSQSTQQPDATPVAVIPQAQPTVEAPHVPTGPIPILANSTARVIATGFNAPSGLAFDRVGNLYIANFFSNSIDRISPDGSKVPFSSGSNLKGPIGVVVDQTGNVYVANYLGGTIVRINPAGVSNVIATNFKKPYYLTMDKDGNLFVSQQEDNSIVRITLPRPIGAKP